MRANSSFDCLGFLMAALLFVVSCAGKEVTDYFTQVAASNFGQGPYIVGTFRTGEVPPILQSVRRIDLAPLSGGYVRGGSALISMGSQGHSWVNPLVKVSGADGYFKLLGVGGGALSATLVLTISQNAPSGFVLEVASEQAAFNDMPIQLTKVGTGDVQVNVSWDVNSDIDLHVVEPSGDEIYSANKGPSATGGQLDLESDGGCSNAGKRSQNITWPRGRAARGGYTARVDYRWACGASKTNYVVTVNVKGQQPQVFYGSFAAADADQGGVGSGRTVTTFTY